MVQSSFSAAARHRPRSAAAAAQHSGRRLGGALSHNCLLCCHACQHSNRSSSILLLHFSSLSGMAAPIHETAERAIGKQRAMARGCCDRIAVRLRGWRLLKSSVGGDRIARRRARDLALPERAIGAHFRSALRGRVAPEVVHHGRERHGARAGPRARRSSDVSVPSCRRTTSAPSARLPVLGPGGPIDRLEQLRLLRREAGHAAMTCGYHVSSVLLPELSHLFGGVVPLERARTGESSAATRLRRASAPTPRTIVAVVDEGTPHGLRRRDVQLGGERLGDQAGGLVEADRGTRSHHVHLST